MTQIMGVVNVTPDSFSDGGDYFTVSDAIARCLKLADDGADIVDIGAESTRPGASFVSYEEEWARLEPVLDGLENRDLGCKVSVDTNKAAVIENLIGTKVSIINNVKGADLSENLLSRLALEGKTYVAMHMHKQPSNMQAEPLDGDAAVLEVDSFFAQTKKDLSNAGFDHDSIWLDPGIGFGKTDRANLRLLKRTLLAWKDYHVLVGISRKSFIGRLLDIPNPMDRDNSSKMLEFALLCSSVKAIRTHDVAALNKLRGFML